MKRWKIIAAAAAGILLAGCGAPAQPRPDPKNPVTITIWHYYNGTQKMAFDNLVEEFNETEGVSQGIMVESHNQGDVNQLEQSVLAALRKEVGSPDPPDVFASYSDVAYALDRQGLLADLTPYLTKEEQADYVDSYLEEGHIGADDKLKIFPTAKSTELMMINRTDWDKFSAATGAELESLSTVEGLVEVARAYYEYTDGLTPDIPGDGRAFFGRDVMANCFLVSAEQLGQRIFLVEGGSAKVNLDKAVMRKIWDAYYLPHLRGYFAFNGRFRSDDTKIGEIIAYVGSTSSASYFPTQVTYGGESYPIEPLTMPAPVFEGGEKVAVQQGAGMVVMKGDPKKEYAAVSFLKWFTQSERNLTFSATSGYLPVKKDANDYDLLMRQQLEEPLSETMGRSLQTAFETVKTHRLYTNKAFRNGSDARKVLEYNLTDKITADLEQVRADMAAGLTREDAVKKFDTDENFEAWYAQFLAALESTVNQETGD